MVAVEFLRLADGRNGRAFATAEANVTHDTGDEQRRQRDGSIWFTIGVDTTTIEFDEATPTGDDSEFLDHVLFDGTHVRLRWAADGGFEYADGHVAALVPRGFRFCGGMPRAV